MKVISLLLFEWRLLNLICGGGGRYGFVPGNAPGSGGASPIFTSSSPSGGEIFNTNPLEPDNFNMDGSVVQIATQIILGRNIGNHLEAILYVARQNESSSI